MLAAELITLVVLLGSVAILATNLRLLVPMEAYPVPERLPRVSVLVPARNEERNIEDCVRSLLVQEYPDFEVLVLDDDSADGTPAILQRLSAADPRLRVLHGEPLPEGWLGKPWACAQLAQAATGELLLFTDADTRHGSRAILSGVANAASVDADLLTAIPHVAVRTWPERLVLPAIPWSTVTTLPLGLAYKTDWEWLCASNGQYLLFRREAYEAVGGHGSVRDEIVEDMAIGRRIRSGGMRWRVGDASDLVATRMYRTLGEIFDGLGKNMFGIFGYGLGRYLLAWPLVALTYLLPTALLAAAALGAPLPPFVLPFAVVLWLLTLGHFWVGYSRFDYPPALALLFPVTMTLCVAIAAWSLVLALSGGGRWKGRSLGRTKVRWF
jgi:chlorobactene glucosyltransferase